MGASTFTVCTQSPSGRTMFGGGKNDDLVAFFWILCDCRQASFSLGDMHKYKNGRELVHMGVNGRQVMLQLAPCLDRST